MAQRLEQAQEAVQTQQLSSLQVAVAKLVELPITELAERVRDEMLENAALEEADAGGVDEFSLSGSADGRNNDAENSSDDSENGDADADNTDGEADGLDDGRSDDPYSDSEGDGADDALGDYLTDDDLPDYLRPRKEEREDGGTLQLSDTPSFYDELLEQMGSLSLTQHECEVMEYLIGSLDADGLLRKELYSIADELAVYHGIDTTDAELARLLSLLQTFEPRGIGARSLQECLRLQLLDPDRRTAYTPLCLDVVDRCFKDFASRRWDNIAQRLHLDNETLGHVRRELTRLNPRPGSAFSEAATVSAPTIVPDFYLTVDSDDDIHISLNRGDVPELRISPAFRESLKQYGGSKANLSRTQRDAYVYARQKVEAAQAFLNLIARRRQTLLAVMHAIAVRQRTFFVESDDEAQLQPLTLREIAEAAGVDISTVSRVTSNKYVQTAYGTYLLKYFFSSRFTTSDGDELSARKVKAALKALIEAEDKHHPLADEALAARLKADGFNVARRTVAKYRDMLGYPTARLRRE